MASIKYLVRSRQNPITKTSKYYALSAPQELVTEEEIIEQISQKSSLNRGDIMSVLSSLREEIRYNLLNGRKVKINDIGCFRTSIKSLGEEAEANVSSSNIKGCRVIFVPSRAIMKALNPRANNVSFVNIESKPAGSLPPETV